MCNTRKIVIEPTIRFIRARGEVYRVCIYRIDLDCSQYPFVRADERYMPCVCVSFVDINVRASSSAESRAIARISRLALSLLRASFVPFAALLSFRLNCFLSPFLAYYIFPCGPTHSVFLLRLIVREYYMCVCSRDAIYRRDVYRVGSRKFARWSVNVMCASSVFEKVCFITFVFFLFHTKEIMEE